MLIYLSTEWKGTEGGANSRMDDGGDSYLIQGLKVTGFCSHGTVCLFRWAEGWRRKRPG